MNKLISTITKLFKQEFSESEITNLSSGEIRRIQMVNIISLIGILNTSFYGIVYSLIDFSTYFIAIIFYFSVATLTYGILITNKKKKRYNVAKVLIILIFPLYITVNSTVLFGTGSSSQVYILLFALIPLFIYSTKQKRHQILFIALYLFAYFAIEFIQTYTVAIYNVPTNYQDLFRNINVFIAFSGAYVAIIYFKKFSNEKENQLRKQSYELKKSYEHRDLVYCIIAHDLRSPFNTLLGFSNLLLQNLRKYDFDKIETQITHINNISSNTFNLLEDLLLWSNSQSGKLIIEPKKVEFSELYNETIKNLQANAHAKNIEVTYIEPENTILFADQHILKTILRNLISNAIKFTKRNGEIKIYIEKNNKIATITISDNGIGIEKDKLEKLWDISEKYTTTGTEKESGTGLGLLLCRDFVEKHGGKIWVESEIGKGSEFKFSMPLYNEQIDIDLT